MRTDLPFMVDECYQRDGYYSTYAYETKTMRGLEDMNDEITLATETDDRIDIRHAAFFGVLNLNIFHFTLPHEDRDG